MPGHACREPYVTLVLDYKIIDIRLNMQTDSENAVS